MQEAGGGGNKIREELIAVLKMDTYDAMIPIAQIKMINTMEKKMV